MLLTAVALCAVQTGCVRRRLTIRSTPPGALVFVDNYEIGTTPVSTGYTYYGTRQIRLVKDGYETVTQLHTIESPWYETPPLDFVSENLVPGELRDERVIDFQLVPQRIVPIEELLQRAGSLRHGAQQGYVVPLPNVGTGTIRSLPGPPAPYLPPAASGMRPPSAGTLVP